MKSRSFGIRTLLIALVSLVVVVPAVWVLFVRLEGEGPAIVSDLEANAVIGGKAVVFRFGDRKSGLRRVRIDLVKDGRETVLYEEDFPRAAFPGGGRDKEKVISLKIPPAGLDIGDGNGALRLQARDYSWRGWFHGNLTRVELPVVIDVTPPRIEVLSPAHNVNQGGAGVVIYRLSEPCSDTGVHIGEEFFPGYAGHFKDPLVYLAFFALGYDQGKDTQLFLSATDAAGNAGRAGFYHHIRRKTFRNDKIVLSDSFLQSKMPEFERYFPSDADAAPIALFLKVNSELRRDNYRSVTDITRNTDKKIHWEGAFLRLPNSARQAGFADKRDYYYNGEKVDRQVHLGIDLASLARSPVEAANAGRVAFAGEIGIYGQTVIIDHGFSLFSMYSHLSTVSVASGQLVARGEQIGLTGSTGLAGGDHLHYGMMIDHVFVNPIEWWDGAWIKNNVTDKIGLASQTSAPDKAAAAASGG